MNQASQLSLPLSIYDSGPESEHAFGFSFLIKRSPRRRTIEIQIHNGKVRLMLPTFVSNAEGLEFVRHKRQWVLDTLSKQQQFLAEVVPKQYRHGEEFEFLGRRYPLNVFVARKTHVELLNGQLLVGLSSRQRQNKSEAIKKALWKWYQQQATNILQQKTSAVAERFQLNVNAVQLRRSKSEWGHCTSDGIIRYNWLIILAPEEVIDYLVAHEVSHLRHHNHSKAFWKHVEKIFPNYKGVRHWLKEYGHRLTV